MKHLLVISLSSLLLTGCLTTRSSLNTGGVQTRSEVDVLREQKTDALMRLTSIDEQLRSLNGRMEVMENNQQSVAPAAASGINDRQFKRLEERFDILRKAVDELDRKVNGKKTSSVSYKKTKVSLAKKTKVIKKNPVASIKSNAFDTAESDFKNNNFIKAIDGYQKYRELNPNGLRYARATYNMGIAFTKLGFKEESKVFFKEVADSHQSSPLAKMAKAQLD